MDELKKVKFRDSHGVASIPQTTSETYSSDLQDAQIKDKTLFVYNSKDKAGKKLLEDNLTSMGQSLEYYLPKEYLTEEDVVVTFETNVQRLQATTREKASRSGWVAKAMQHFPKETKAVAEAINSLQLVCDNSTHFVQEWIDTTKVETETETIINKQLYSGATQFALVGKRSINHGEKKGEPTREVSVNIKKS